VKSLKIHKDLPGPGYYNPIIMARDFDRTQKNFYFKSENERFMATKIDEIPGPGKYFKKDKNGKIQDNTVSYFFKKPIEKILTPEDKLINEKKEFTFPGPGAYDLRTDLLKKTKEEENLSYKREKIKFESPTKIIPPKIIIEKEKKKEKTDYYDVPSCFDKIKLGEKSANFKSNSPKVEIKRKKTPGPAYYKPQVLPSKLSYNYNMEKIWI
jgi:hypothetical protein